MERRSLLKAAAGLGATLTGSLPEMVDAAEPSLPLEFFEGTLQGEDFASWTVSLALVGKRVQGLAYDPATVGGTSSEFRGLRFEGRVAAGGLTLRAYRWRDLNLTRPIGSLEGGRTRNGLEGDLSVRLAHGPELSTGRATLDRIAISRAATRRLAGAYAGSTAYRHGGRFSAHLTARPNQTWELRRLRAEGGQALPGGLVGGRVTGHYAVAEDGRLLVAITRVPLSFRNPDRERYHEEEEGAAPARGNAGAAASAPAGANDASHGGGVGPKAAESFADNTFADRDWTPAKIIDVNEGGSGRFETHQGPSGGNPGTYRRISLTNGEGTIGVAHLRRGFSYDPRARGAVTSIDYHFDLKANPLMQFALLLRQAGTYYAAPDHYVYLDQFYRYGQTGVGAELFTRIAGNGPARPDFSGTGSPIELGFLSLNGPTGGGTQTRFGGIDNYSVALQRGAQAPLLELNGPASVIEGSEVEYTVAASNPSGSPLGGVPVVLSAVPQEGNAIGPLTGTTDASGRVAFTLTFPNAGVGRDYIVTAFLDPNRSGAREPGEPQQTMPVDVGPAISLDGPRHTENGRRDFYQVQLRGPDRAGQRVVAEYYDDSDPARNRDRLADFVTDADGAGGFHASWSAGPNGATLTLIAYWDTDRNGIEDSSDPADSLGLEIVSTEGNSRQFCRDTCTSIVIGLQGTVLSSAGREAVSFVDALSGLQLQGRRE